MQDEDHSDEKSGSEKAAARRSITRRDFLNGTQVALGASLLSPWAEALGAPEQPATEPVTGPVTGETTGKGGNRLGAGYYPPSKTGLRGSHDGSWETMHARVSGTRWPQGRIEEEYDLVVVGAGISGLSAAFFYQREKPDARILLLDNHDDFGGHAKRNEFTVDGQTRIGYGGTESIDTPSSYSGVAKQLLVDVGVDVEKFYDYYDQQLYGSMDLGYAIAFDEATYGKRQLATGYGSLPWAEFAAGTPLNARAREDLVRVFTDERDYLPGLSLEEKRELLSTTSYYDFMKDHVKVDQQILEMYRRWGMSYWCVGMDEVPAIAVQGYGDGGGIPGLSHTMPRTGHRGDEPYIFHFPDGNASVARLLVRALLPDVVPGSSMEDVVTSRLRYPLLDQPGAATRIRLNSTAVDVVHTADAKAVNVTYVRQGAPHTVRAGQCIMACYNSAIPYLCSELPEAQREGLAYNVKIPLTYTKVMVRNWRAFAELNTRFVYYTNDFYKQVELDYPVSLGDYRFGANPNDPMVLHMCYVPYFQDVKGPEQWREGRRALLSTPFATFEHHVRDQLDQALAGAGFDAGRDIEAITVNRWAHGYSYSPGLLWEPQWPDDASKPWVIGRAPFGRIFIANSDAAASADTNAAITQAHRAVSEALSANAAG